MFKSPAIIICFMFWFFESISLQHCSNIFISPVEDLQIALNIKLLGFLLEISIESDSIAPELILSLFLVYSKATHE